MPFRATADQFSPFTRTIPSGRRSPTATPSAPTGETRRRSATLTPRGGEPFPSERADAGGYDEISAEQGPQHRCGPPVDGHHDEPEGRQRTEHPRGDMGVGTDMEPDQRDEHDQPEQNPSYHPHGASFPGCATPRLTAFVPTKRPPGAGRKLRGLARISAGPLSRGGLASRCPGRGGIRDSPPCPRRGP